MTNLLPDDDHRSSHGLKNAVRGGTRAVAAVQILSQIVSLIALAILYRTVSDNPPREYGLLAMVVPVIMFLRIFTMFGLDISLVQRQSLDHRQLSSIFWLNLTLGVATAVVTALLAPSVAWFFAEPVLVHVTLALAGTAIVAALGAPHQALLQRRLRLGRLALVKLAAQALGAIAAVVAALAGWGIWALVLQQYVELTSLALIAWAAEPWTPNRPRWPLASMLEDLKGHLGFGGYHTASSVLFYLADNLDKIIVGRFVGAQALGLYSQAFNLAFKPVALLCTPLTGIMLASLSRVNDQSDDQSDDRSPPSETQEPTPETRQEILVAFYRLAAIVLLPIAIGLAVVGADALRLLGGSAWNAGGPILQVLALAIFSRALIHLAGPVFSAAGRTDRMFLGAVVVLILLAQGYVAGWWFGAWQGNAALGVAWGYTLTVGVVLSVPFTLYCLGSTTPAKPASRARDGRLKFLRIARPLLGAMARPLFASLLMGLSVIAFRQLLTLLPTISLAVSLILQISIGVAIYCLAAKSHIAWLLSQLFRSDSENAA